ncbi:MAG: hypothetical protein QOF31_2153 [Mycobacterium sp.]|jgi:hypothetical protein|nr:hypothetical protein [Mycobacterium sp.]
MGQLFSLLLLVGFVLHYFKWIAAVSGQWIPIHQPAAPAFGHTLGPAKCSRLKSP